MSRIVSTWSAVLAFTAWTGTAHAEQNPNYVAFGLAFPQVSLNLVSKPVGTNTATSSTNYSADTSGLFTTEASYDGVTLGYSFALGGPPKGSSTTTDTNFDLSYFSTFWGVSAAYVNLTGMNADSGSGQTSASVEHNPVGHRPDIRLTSTAANVWLTPYRNNLNLDDLFNPARKAHGCGFALLVIGSYDSLGIALKEPFYLSPSTAAYGTDSAFTGGQFYSGSVSLGPAIMLERYGFYLAAFLALGGGEETGRYQDGGTSYKAKDRPAKTLIYAALGYRGDTYFTALTFSQEQPQYTLDTVELQITRGNVAWTFGRRF